MVSSVLLLLSLVSLSLSSSLVIYTYDTLLATPPYDFASAFEQYAGIPQGTVQVLRFGDAGVVLEAASNFVALNLTAPDILIGLDNVLQLETSANLLIPYSSPSLAYLDPNLISLLGGNYHLLPYDYGFICLVYDSTKVTQSDLAIVSSPTFSLENIIGDNSILNKMVLEDPRLSSPGLAFLLLTISVFGDSSLNITGPAATFNGLNNYDWTSFWTQISGKFQLAPTWNDGANLFYNESDIDAALFGSYGTDPTYNYCNYNLTNVIAIPSHENGLNAWFQVEGIGIMKTSNNIPLAQQFVDWFLNSTLQSEIATHQWVFPANINVQLPPCYQTPLTLLPSSISKPNPQLTTAVIGANLQTWLNKWANITGAAPLPPPTENTNGASFPTPVSPTTTKHNSSSSLSFQPFFALALAMMVKLAF